MSRTTKKSPKKREFPWAIQCHVTVLTMTSGSTPDDESLEDFLVQAKFSKTVNPDEESATPAQNPHHSSTPTEKRTPSYNASGLMAVPVSPVPPPSLAVFPPPPGRNEPLMNTGLFWRNASSNFQFSVIFSRYLCVRTQSKASR
jgi:hypothetical protein